MDPNCNQGPPPRGKVPKDGVGPRGVPECYYTSRVLHSTFRYVRFIKKLRAQEAEERMGAEILTRDMNDKQRFEFFSRSDRKNLINKVAYRVDLCLQSYDDDLQQRRNKLLEMLTNEEELNTRLFVKQAQEGPELIWQAKKERLAFLLAKRKQEHDSKHAATPLTKPTHLHPCLVNARTKESKEFQLYQIREKQMRREAEKELDKMWYEVAMKESEALAARMEYEEMERARRENDCKQHNDREVQLKRMQLAKEREALKEQVLQRKLQMEEDSKQKAEEERVRKETSAKTDQDKKEMLKERLETVAKQEADSKLVNDTWDKLTALRKDDGKIEEELRRRKERELDVCNRRVALLNHELAKFRHNNEHLILEEGRQLRDEVDLKRCQRRMWSHRTQVENAAANKKTALEKEADLNKIDDEKEYYQQLRNQLDELVKHKELTEAQARKLYQKDLAEQIAYNKLLKERAQQEQLDQNKKCEIATKEYFQELAEMLRRPFYSNEVHPFLKQMASGLEITKCPCSLPTYCADPIPKAAEKK